MYPETYRWINGDGRPRRRIISLVAIGVLAASCSTPEMAKTTQTAVEVNPPTVTSPTVEENPPTVISPTVSTSMVPAVTTTEGNADAVAVASEFLVARQSRDFGTLDALLHDDAFLDWGPGRDKETLGLGLSWEDAAGITNELIECSPIGEAEAGYEVLCTMTVHTAVAAALGDIPGCNPATVYVQDAKVAEAILEGSVPGCDYNYWTKMFVPFNAWVEANHPETTPDAMYDDRISPEGLELWRLLIDEFVAEQ